MQHGGGEGLRYVVQGVVGTRCRGQPDSAAGVGLSHPGVRGAAGRCAAPAGAACGGIQPPAA